MCYFPIPEIEPEERPSYGDDILQALWLCLKQIQMRIALAESAGTVLWWAKPGDWCLLK
ncbi:hypothetical protein Mal4_54930 [Maioricimonas rarisocia]|uniref:Uncharacterized protein n=2 Tax=Maioricimonas rarisocia TaxID=2528026 RepID=A0A517ZF72_9PLAN|nr:hypothetical protein [Maioricimonas rarisocia]QDU41128.1 hypothetical protein Mal4_54930 [Maioricimonas rarisocia]